MVARKSLKTMSGWLWHDSESIATKVCSQISSKRNAMFEIHSETSIDRTSFNFRFNFFFSNLLLKTIIFRVNGQPSITLSRRSVRNLKFSVVTFLRLMSCSMSIEQKLCEDKNLNSNLCRISWNVSRKCLLSRIVYLVWPWYSTWAIHKWRPNKTLLQGCETWRVMYLFFCRSVRTNGLVDMASRSE